MNAAVCACGFRIEDSMMGGAYLMKRLAEVHDIDACSARMAGTRELVRDEIKKWAAEHDDGQAARESPGCLDRGSTTASCLSVGSTR